MTQSSKRLVQVRLSEQGLKQLEELRVLSGLNTTEIVKFSVALFKWAVEKQKKGFEIYALPPEGVNGEGERIQFLVPL
jgi:hypothetical protein